MNAAHSKPSQAAAILAHLTAGHALTQGEAKRLFGCARLASRIDELKHRDAPIQRRMIKVPGHDGTTARVAEYFIPQPSPEPSTQP